MASINTEGVSQVGEINSRLMREAVVEPDFSNAWVSGAVQAYTETIAFADRQLAAAGPYDDVRALGQLILWCRDRIAQVTANGMPNADQS